MANGIPLDNTATVYTSPLMDGSSSVSFSSPTKVTRCTSPRSKASKRR